MPSRLISGSLHASRAEIEGIFAVVDKDWFWLDVQPLLMAEERDYLTARLGVSAIALANYRPRYNIAPQQEHFIVTTEYERRKVTSAKWGL